MSKPFYTTASEPRQVPEEHWLYPATIENAFKGHRQILIVFADDSIKECILLGKDESGILVEGDLNYVFYPMAQIKSVQFAMNPALHTQRSTLDTNDT